MSTDPNHSSATMSPAASSESAATNAAPVTPNAPQTQQQGPAEGNAVVPFLGSKISLISKSEIRYEGTLYTIDTKESTVALQRVRMFGTEDRRVEKPVMASTDVYEYIIFRGTDIKDLRVIYDRPPAPAIPPDPAILSHGNTTTAPPPPIAPQYPPAGAFPQYPPPYAQGPYGGWGPAAQQGPGQLMPPSQLKQQAAAAAAAAAAGQQQQFHPMMSPYGMSHAGAPYMQQMAPYDAAGMLQQQQQPPQETAPVMRQQVQPQQQQSGRRHLEIQRPVAAGAAAAAAVGQQPRAFPRPQQQQQQRSAFAAPVTQEEMGQEFDFESSNSKLDKAKLQAEYEAMHGSIAVASDAAPRGYDKKSSFFDNLSCESADRSQRGPRRFAGNDVETFGPAAASHRGGWGNRGRGFRRGGPGGQQYGGNQRGQRYHDDLLQAPAAAPGGQAPGNPMH